MTHHIKAVSIEDSWYLLLRTIMEKGNDFTVTSGSYCGTMRKELFNCVIDIDRPYLGSSDPYAYVPKLSEQSIITPPVDEQFFLNYLNKVMTYDKDRNESYTYGERLWRYLLSGTTSLKEDLIYSEIAGSSIEFDNFQRVYLDQVTAVIAMYKKFGHRTNQAVLQIAQPTDIFLKDPPCMRQIDTRIQDNKLHFFVEFRSWDAWGGYPCNIPALQVLKEYMAEEIGVDDGGLYLHSKGLHLYEYCWEYVKCLLNM